MAKRELISLEGNGQALDGGAMFGNAPRALWSKWIKPDRKNRIKLATRCLLVREDDRLILFETGVGAYLEPKLADRFGVKTSKHVLLDSLAEHDLTHEDIDVVVLSHLHFDHAGGLLSKYEKGGEVELLFPNARIITSADNFARASGPHMRDRASFIGGLTDMLQLSGRLELVGDEGSNTLGDDYRFYFSNGHTPGMMLTEIATDDGPLVFVADLAPGRPWTHLPITMGYDRSPELLIDEKRRLFEDLIQRSGRLFYTHDPDVDFAELVRNERGRFEGRPIT